jgi:DNA-binding transcriptional regulator LsrR (DeoR family)
MSAPSETRLVTKVAALYHEQKLTRTDIAKRLGISQVTVSRLLKRAKENQIVRTTVISPPGAFVEFEDILERKFGLTQSDRWSPPLWSQAAEMSFRSAELCKSQINARNS